jgi:hypothetical protein
VYRTLNGLWVPLFDMVVPRNNNVIAVLGTPAGKLCIPGRNTVTDAGDIFYAQQGCSESPTNDWTAATAIMELCTAGTPAKGADRSDFTTVSATQKIFVATPDYPLTNDVDADNSGTTGTDVVTYLTSWTKGDFTQSGITHGIITNGTPGTAEPILTGYVFGASFNKTADDTLKVFVNHQMNGV